MTETRETPERLDLDLAGADLTLVGERRWAVGRERGWALLLSGGGQTRHSWDRSAEDLQREGWTAVTLDMRGHGESDWEPDGDYSIERIAADTIEVCRRLGAGADPATRPVLIGASMGGLASLLAAGAEPECCRALVLVDIALRVEPEGSRRVRAFMGSKPEGFASLEEAAAAVVAYNPHRTGPVNLERLGRNLRQSEDGRWRWHWDPRLLVQDEASNHDSQDPDHPLRVALREAAESLTVPVLLVRGMRSDVVSPEGLEEAKRLLPNAAVAEVSDAGHMVAGDDNETFLEAIRTFLATL